HAEAGHGGKHQHALEAEVDAARFLGDALGQAHHEEGRADANGAAQDGDEEVERDVHGQRACTGSGSTSRSGWACAGAVTTSAGSGTVAARIASTSSGRALDGTTSLPRSASLARINRNAKPCSTST